jgi:hypothetical protein
MGSIHSHEQKVATQYVQFCTKTGKQPSLLSQNKDEKELAQQHLNILFEMNRKKMFLFM